MGHPHSRGGTSSIQRLGRGGKRAGGGGGVRELDGVEHDTRVHLLRLVLTFTCGLIGGKLATIGTVRRRNRALVVSEDERSE
jgi:hypothetical protein